MACCAYAMTIFSYIQGIFAIQKHAFMPLQYIIWDINPILTQIGAFSVRWYGLLFALGFVLGRQLWHSFLKQEGKHLQDLDTFVLHIMLGTIIGARLGHVLFYDFSYFLQHPLEIFLPCQLSPTFKFTGYSGLASHGAAIGILTSIYIYANYVITIRLLPPRLMIKKQRRVGQSYLWIADRLMIVVALAGFFIRIGNFMNSEVIGKPTQHQHGVVFARSITDVDQLPAVKNAIDSIQIQKGDTQLPCGSQYQPVILTIRFKHYGFSEIVIRNFIEYNIKRACMQNARIAEHIYEPQDAPLQYKLSKSRQGAYLARVTTLGIPRHPAQLYEAFSCLILFLFLFHQWKNKKALLRPGLLFGVFLTAVFSLRIVYEFFKESNVVCDTILGPLRMPQLLSFPLVIAGITLLVYSSNKKYTA